MSLEATEAIRKYLDERDNGIPLSAIKHRIAEFVKERDSRYVFNTRSTSRSYYSYDDTYCVREGQILERKKIK